MYRNSSSSVIGVRGRVSFRIGDVVVDVGVVGGGVKGELEVLWWPRIVGGAGPVRR